MLQVTIFGLKLPQYFVAYVVTHSCMYSICFVQIIFFAVSNIAFIYTFNLSK